MTIAYSRVHRHSLGWVWLRHHGIGTGLIAAAAAHAGAAGCDWLHVDFEDHLSGFYLGACGFTPTMAGLIALTGDADPSPAG